MSFKGDLIGWLQDHGSITGDFYYEDADEAASLPFCILDVTSERNDYTQAAAGIQKPSLSIIEIDFLCYGATAFAANTLANELLSVIETFKGTVPDTSSPATTSHIEKAIKTADFTQREEQSDSYYRSITMIISYR